MIVLVLALSLFGCYYHEPPRGTLHGIQSIGIPRAKTQAGEADLAEAFTDLAQQAYAADGRLKVVDEEWADAVLYLTILAIDDWPDRFKVNPDRYRFSVMVSAYIRNSDTGQVLFKDSEMVGWGTYDAKAEPDSRTGRFGAQENAFKKVVAELLEGSFSRR